MRYFLYLCIVKLKNMKIIEDLSSDKIEISSQREHKKMLKLEGSLRPSKDHSVFKRHKITGEISKTEILFESFNYNYYLASGDPWIQGKIIDNGNYEYVTALNMKNAEKKFSKK